MLNTSYIRQLAEDLADSGKEATAADFLDCADEIDSLCELVRETRLALKALIQCVEVWAEENDHSELVNCPSMIRARKVTR